MKNDELKKKFLTLTSDKLKEFGVEGSQYLVDRFGVQLWKLLEPTIDAYAHQREVEATKDFEEKFSLAASIVITRTDKIELYKIIYDFTDSESVKKVLDHEIAEAVKVRAMTVKLTTQHNKTGGSVKNDQ